MTLSRQGIDDMASENYTDQRLNGFPKLPDIPVEDVISGPNENTDYEDTEYDVERSKVAARRRTLLKYVPAKEEDSVSAAFCTWLFEHQIG